MRKLIKLPLALRRETVRHLSTASLVGVVGALNVTEISNKPDDCPTAKSVSCPQSGVFCQG
jgi:hypothetical protein